MSRTKSVLNSLRTCGLPFDSQLRVHGAFKKVHENRLQGPWQPLRKLFGFVALCFGEGQPAAYVFGTVEGIRVTTIRRVVGTHQEVSRLKRSTVVAAPRLRFRRQMISDSGRSGRFLQLSCAPA